MVPSVGDTFAIDTMPLEKLWWLRSIILQENPDSHVEMEISLLRDGVEDNNFEFPDFKVPVESERGLLLNAMFSRNRTVVQKKLVQGDTVSGAMSFSYFRELAKIGFLPLLDPHAKGGMTRQVSYIGFEGSILHDLEGNVAMYNAPAVVVADTASQAAPDAAPVAQDAAPASGENVVAEPQTLPRLEIRRKILVDGKPIDSYNEFTDQLGILEDMMTAAKTQADSLKVRTATIVIEREGLAMSNTDDKTAVPATVRDTATVTLTPELKLGFFVKSLAGLYEPYTREYGFLESIPAGIKYGWNVLAGYVGDMKYVFTADGAKSLGGFGAIGSLFPPMWDWYLFWKMTAFLSIILAFMNILPIPALDGGHVLFLFYEMITRRKPSETFMIRAEYVGFGLLILLMVFANLNDILRWLGYM